MTAVMMARLQHVSARMAGGARVVEPRNVRGVVGTGAANIM